MPVIAYDVPMSLGVQAFNGIEVSGWAAHDKLAPPASYPADLLPTIMRRFGEWHIGPEQYGPPPVTELLELRDQLASRGVEFALAGKRHLIEEWRRQRGFVGDSVEGRPGLRLFSTLEDAVDALAAAPVGDDVPGPRRG